MRPPKDWRCRSNSGVPPGKNKALSSNPSITKKKKGKEKGEGKQEGGERERSGLGCNSMVEPHPDVLGSVPSMREGKEKGNLSVRGTLPQK
jgi:hypothetical protein